MAPLHRASGFVRGPSSSILDVLSASGCGAIMRQSRQKRMRHSHRLLGVGLDRLPPHFRMQGGVASHPEWSFGVHCDSAISSGGAGPRRAYRTFSFSLASDCGGTPMGHVTIGVRGGCAHMASCRCRMWLCACARPPAVGQASRRSRSRSASFRSAAGKGLPSLRRSSRPLRRQAGRTRALGSAPEACAGASVSDRSVPRFTARGQIQEPNACLRINFLGASVWCLVVARASVAQGASLAHMRRLLSIRLPNPM